MREPRPIDAYVLADEVFASKNDNPHTDGIVRRTHEHEHEHFLRMIANAPTIDAVPVVRCKDCRWSRTNQKDDADVYYCELRTGRAYHSGDFCSYGERKEGEG